MKSTGIVRPGDSLGRVVLPIELRRIWTSTGTLFGGIRRRRPDHSEEISARMHLLRQRRRRGLLRQPQHLQRPAASHQRAKISRRMARAGQPPWGFCYLEGATGQAPRRRPRPTARGCRQHLFFLFVFSRPSMRALAGADEVEQAGGVQRVIGRGFRWSWQRRWCLSAARPGPRPRPPEWPSIWPRPYAWRRRNSRNRRSFTLNRLAAFWAPHCTEGGTFCTRPASEKPISRSPGPLSGRR